MAEITITKWQCDRCGKIESRWKKPASAYSLQASVDHGTSGGSVITWKEVCRPCNEIVQSQLTEMKKSSVTDRQAVINSLPTPPNEGEK